MTARLKASAMPTSKKFTAEKTGWSDEDPDSARRRGARRYRVKGPRTAFAAPWQGRWASRVAWMALAAYVLYAASILDVTWERFAIGLEQGARFIGRMFPPDIAPDKLR